MAGAPGAAEEDQDYGSLGSMEGLTGLAALGPTGISQGPAETTGQSLADIGMGITDISAASRGPSQEPSIDLPEIVVEANPAVVDPAAEPSTGQTSFIGSSTPAGPTAQSQGLTGTAPGAEQSGTGMEAGPEEAGPSAAATASQSGITGAQGGPASETSSGIGAGTSGDRGGGTAGAPGGGQASGDRGGGPSGALGGTPGSPGAALGGPAAEQDQGAASQGAPAGAPGGVPGSTGVGVAGESATIGGTPATQVGQALTAALGALNPISTAQAQTAPRRGQPGGYPARGQANQLRADQEAARQGASDYANAIAQVETRSYLSPYQTVGPTTRHGRALGRYQILGSNLRGANSFGRNATGRDIGNQEFLDNPDLQNQVFNHAFSQILARHGGNFEMAAREWNGGPRGPANPGMGYRGYTVGQYGRDALGALIGEQGRGVGRGINFEGIEGGLAATPGTPATALPTEAAGPPAPSVPAGRAAPSAIVSSLDPNQMDIEAAQGTPSTVAQAVPSTVMSPVAAQQAQPGAPSVQAPSVPARNVTALPPYPLQRVPAGRAGPGAPAQEVDVQTQEEANEMDLAAASSLSPSPVGPVAQAGLPAAATPGRAATAALGLPSRAPAPSAPSTATVANLAALGPTAAPGVPATSLAALPATPAAIANVIGRATSVPATPAQPIQATPARPGPPATPARPGVPAAPVDVQEAPRGPVATSVLGLPAAPPAAPRATLPPVPRPPSPSRDPLMDPNLTSQLTAPFVSRGVLGQTPLGQAPGAPAARPSAPAVVGFDLGQPSMAPGFRGAPSSGQIGAQAIDPFGPPAAQPYGAPNTFGPPEAPAPAQPAPQIAAPAAPPAAPPSAPPAAAPPASAPSAPPTAPVGRTETMQAGLPAMPSTPTAATLGLLGLNNDQPIVVPSRPSAAPRLAEAAPYGDLSPRERALADQELRRLLGLA